MDSVQGVSLQCLWRAPLGCTQSVAALAAIGEQPLQCLWRAPFAALSQCCGSTCLLCGRKCAAAHRNHTCVACVAAFRLPLQTPAQSAASTGEFVVPAGWQLG